MLKSYKYRIYPNCNQQEMIEKTIGVCRLVYNLALQVKIDAYNANGIKLSAFDLCRQLAEMKKDYPWMRDVDSQALQASVKKVDVAFKNFFRGFGYPKFKKKHGTQGFLCPNGKRRVDFKKQLLTIPKIKDIPIAISREFFGKIKTVSISRNCTGKYFASILVDNEAELPTRKPVIESSSIGIDLGIKHFAILSDCNKIDNPAFLRSEMKRLKCLQRRLTKKKKGSKNRNKARIKVALQHERITNKRNDFLHKLSSAITKQYDSVCVEDLQIKNMVKNRKLSLSILDASWGEFIRQLKYKLEWNGGNLLELPKFQASTKPCSICGEKNESLTLADREWACANCGAIHDRDINAAINIKKYFFKNLTDGRSGLACGVAGVSRSEETGNTTCERQAG